METSKMALAISGIGFLLALSGWIRYFILFYDLSQMLIFMLLGGLIFYVGYSYNWKVQRQKDISKLEKRLDAVVMKLMGLEKEQVNNDIMGEE